LSKINRHPVRRTAAGVLAGALTLTGAVAVATPAAAAPTFGLERIQGEGRYETSAAIARAFIAANTGAVTNVILASGESTNTPDALAASFLAGVQNAPVVLTQRSTTPGATRDVLATLRAQGATTLTIVGGTAAVSEEQATALTALGWTVRRIGGANRYETAANIATAGEAGGTNGAASNVGLLASGTSTIDALAGGPVAFKGRHPLFLTTRDGIPGATLRSMQANGVTSVFILGGEAVVGPRVVAQLAAANIRVESRLFGADRSATSVAIANAVIGGTFGFSASTFNVASGINGGVDALGGAALSGKQNRVLLVTNTATSAAPITAFATARQAQLTTVGTIFGGTTVVAAALETAIETAAGATGAGNNQRFTVTPNTASVVNVVAGTTDTDTSDDVVYTVTNAVVGAVHQIRLAPGANVQTSGTGNVTFTELGTGNTADFGTVAARITAVNGVPTGAGGQATATITPTTTTFTFRVEGASAEAVTPVIFFDANSNGSLDLDADNRPTATELFGIGGTTFFVPAAAVLGTNGGTQTFASFNADLNFVATNALTFRYDANDVFQFQGVNITEAQFEGLLGSGAQFTVNYNPTAGGVSTFNITTGATTAGVTTVSAAVRALGGDSVFNDVVVTYTRPSGNPAGTTYVLQRRASGDADASFATVTTATQAAGTGTGVFAFTDLNVPNGTYVYRVQATNNVTGIATAGTNTATVTVPGSAETDRPMVVSTRVVTNGGFATDVDAGDVFRIVLNEDVTVSGAAALRFEDSVGDDFQLTAGTNATFALNAAPVTIASGSDAGTYAANRVLTVTVTGNPTPINGTLAAALPATFPITILSAAGITDLAGNALNPAPGAVAAAATISGVTATAATAGTAGNAYSIQVVTGPTGAGNENRALAATFAGNVVTVTLGTNGAGATQAATRAAIATAVNALPEVNATVTTAGADVAGAVGSVTFTGGAASGSTTINP